MENCSITQTGDVALSFSHACFLSYRHSDKEKTIKFIEQFVDALENCLDQYLPAGVGIYLDKDRLKPGYKFNVAIANALRESVCMVAILSMQYFQSSYCRREFSAMRKIEAQRKIQTGKPCSDKGLIIPILVWATEEDVPDDIRNEIHFDPINFSLTNLRSEIKYDPNLAVVMERISEVVIDLYRNFHSAGLCQQAVECCAGIDLPSEDDVVDMWEPRQQIQQPLPSRVAAGAAR